MKKIILLSSILALGACTDFKSDVRTANNNFRQSAAKITHSVRDYFNPPPEVKPQKKEMPPSYCYKALTDVVCYDSPQPDKQDKLVGKQVPSSMSNQALTGGDPNVSVMDVKEVPPPAPAISTSTTTTTTTTTMEPPSPGGNGQAPHALMPQF